MIAQVSGGSRGASWGPDDSIIFATSDTTTGLLRVAARGGEPEVLTRPDTNDGEQDHLFPSLLPGGRGVLFTIVEGGSQRRVAVQDLNTGKWKTVIRSGSQAYTRRRVTSSTRTAERCGPSDSMRRRRIASMTRCPCSSASRGAAPAPTCLLTTRDAGLPPSAGAGDARSLVWVDRRGNDVSIAAPARTYFHPRLSPDGTRVAVSIANGQRPGAWIWDFSLQKLSPLQTGPVGAFLVSSRDSRYLIFGSQHLFRRAADGTGAVEQLTTSDVRCRSHPAPRRGDLARWQAPDLRAADAGHVVRPDGAPSRRPTTSNDDANRASPLLDTPSDERHAAIAPDGRWIAYESNKTGRFQVYVRPFPNLNDAECQISTAGGRTPLFAPNGRELFFVGGPALMAAAVDLASGFRASNATVVFNAPSLSSMHG